MTAIDLPVRVTLSPSFTTLVSDLNQRYLRAWWDGPSGFPAQGPVYTLSQKFPRERRLSRYINFILSELKDLPPTAAAREAARERLTNAFVEFAAQALDLEERHLDIVLHHGFLDATLAFADQARRYDPSVTGADIYQAGRNVYTMNLIQFLLGMPVRLTPSIFAFSMLYPYTDNYLDDPTVSSGVKQAFNERFYRRLLGERVPAANPREEKIFDMIALIEGEFERSRYPQVYDSLLAIHAAQEKSMRLLSGAPSGFEVDVLGISFEKGGTTVLADGYLVAGELTAMERDVFYGYGVFTQLMDDQEDVQSDLAAGQVTPFTATAKGWPLDGITNRALRLGDQIMDGIGSFDVPNAASIQELFRRSIHLLLIDAAGSHRRFYTRDYLRQVEPYLPFRFSYLSRERKKLARRRLSLANLVDSFAPSQDMNP